MGAVSDALAVRARRAFGAEIRTRRPGRPDRSPVAGGPRRGARRRRGGRRLGRRRGNAPAGSRSCGSWIADELPDDFVRDIRNWKSRQRHREDQPGARPTRPCSRRIPSSRDLTGGFELAHSIAYLEKAFEEARSGMPATAPFSDGVMPTFHDPTLAPEGKHVVSLFTQWCPAGVGRRASRGGARRLRGPRDRRLRRARAGVHRLGPAPAGDRAARDGTGVGADRRQHLPRRALGRAAVPHAAGAGVRRLPHPDPRAVPMLERDARRRRRDRHPRVQLRPRDLQGSAGAASAGASEVRRR